MNHGPSPGLRAYLMSMAAHFAAGGAMGVILPWLLTHELHEKQSQVGVAQMIGSLPMMVLVLFGGVAADGRNLRRYLGKLHIAAAIVTLILAITVSLHLISLAAVAICAFALSIVSAFMMPARDTLLSHVVPHSLGIARAVPLSVAVTFGGQLVGTAIAALASTTGAVPILCLQATLLALAGSIIARVQLETPVHEHAPAPFQRWLDAALEGFTVAWGHERLRTILLYLVLGAPLFNGWFMVGIPLMVRDVYKLDAPGISAVYTAFLLGLTLSAFASSRLPQTDRPGRLMMCLSVNNIFVFAVTHYVPRFEYFVALMFWWGITSGVAMSLTRGMVQVAAPHAYRARVLAMLQFANVAGGPPGSLLYGLLAQAVGIANAVLVIPFTVVFLWSGFFFLTDLWNFRREDHHHPATAQSPGA